jgi:ATP-binding cassette subfamily B multidrug efflux pump
MTKKKHQKHYICNMRSLAYLNRYFYKYRRRFILGIVFVIISNLFGVLPPQIIRESVDLIAGSIRELHKADEAVKGALLRGFSAQLAWFAFLVLLMSLLKGLFMFFMRQTIIVMSRWIEFDLKNELFDKYQSLSLSFFRRNKTGDLMARISEDVGKVRMYIGPAMMYGVNMLVLFVIVITVMVRVNPTLTLYVLLPLPVLSVGIYYINNLILSRSTAIQEQLGRLTAFSQEAFSGIRVIKSYGLEKAYQAEFEAELDDYRQKSMALVRADALFYPMTLLLIGASTIMTIYIGGIQVSKGLITPGNIAEFVIYVNMLTWPVTSVGWVASIVQQAGASQQRINDLLHVTPEIINREGELHELMGSFKFEKVSFTYTDSGIKALSDISFEIKPGQTIGVVGPTGSGKSTLANLITRMYDAQEGQIYVDGKPLQSLHPGNYRQQLGYVPQDVFLFSDSIENNIAFGNKAASAADIERAARMAALWPTIERMPDGLKTVIGERGVSLSGGQKQRLSIARAIIRQPRLYVIDDCLSALDTNTEQEILANIKAITADVSSLIISHRVSSVQQADQIIVLDHGKVVERGTHDELILRNGYYAAIYQKQQEEPANQMPSIET